MPHFPSPKLSSLACCVSGVLPLLLGLVAQFQPAGTAMSLSGAPGRPADLAFILLGLALLAIPGRGMAARLVAGGAAALLVLLVAAGLTGRADGLPAGFAFAAATAGLAVLALAVRWRFAYAAGMAAGALILGSALLSLLSSALGNVLFAGYGTGQLPVVLPGVLIFALTACGLLCRVRADRMLRRFTAGREDRAILLSSGALFALVSLVAGLAGIGIAGRYVMGDSQHSWRQSFRTNADLLEHELSSAIGRLQAIMRLSSLDSRLAAGARPDQADLTRLMDLGAYPNLRSARLLAPAWPAQSAGVPSWNGQFSLALRHPDAARLQLFYANGWRALVGLRLPASGALVELELALPRFSAAYDQLSQTGRSGEIRLCAPDGTRMRCFPSRLLPQPSTFPMTTHQPLAMHRALHGESGLTGQRDYRGQQVVAAYDVLKPFGIGMVQKVDAEEFYAPLRHQLWIALALLALLIATGAGLLYARTRPLVRRLRASGARLAATLENIPAGVLTFRADGRIATANACAERMFDSAPGGLRGRAVAPLLGEAVAGPAAGTAPAVSELVIAGADGRARRLRAHLGSFRLDGASKGIVILQDVSAQQAVQAELRRSEDNLARAQQMARLGSWYRDLVNDTMHWSANIFTLFGLEPGTPPCRETVLQMIDERDRAAVLAADLACTTAGQSYDLVFRILPAGGGFRILHAMAQAECGADGRPLRQHGTVQEISERWLNEQRLRASEEEFRALAANSPDVIARFHRDRRCIYVNPAIIDAPGLAGLVVAGLTPQALPGREELAQQWSAAIDMIVAHGNKIVFESESRTAAGPATYQVLMVPEVDASKRTAAVLAVARDITAIRAGQAELHASEQRMRSIAAATPGIVFQFELDRAGILRYTYVSDGAAALLGVAPAAAIADPDALLARLHPDDLARFRIELARAGARLEPIDCEGRASGPDGAPVWINCRATPRRAGDGVIAWAGVMLDITARKRNQQELAESRALLRELAAHKEGLREEERRRLAREVHDELGQALTALRMDVALLRLQFGAGKPDLLSRLDDMTGCVDRTIGLVRDITSSLRPAALDLGLVAALEWLLEDVRRRAPVEVQLRAPASDVELDDHCATALFRIVQESLNNVLKHAQARHVEIKLVLADGQVLLELTDDGIGFDVHAPRRPGAFGLLGMQERVLMLAGRLDVASSPAGTRVRVSLPYVERKETLWNTQFAS